MLQGTLRPRCTQYDLFDYHGHSAMHEGMAPWVKESVQVEGGAAAEAQTAASLPVTHVPSQHRIDSAPTRSECPEDTD